MTPTFDFITALKFVSHAQGTNDVRYYLNGVLFRFVGNTLALTASDGHRIAQIRLGIEGCPLAGDYIVKADSVKAALATVKTKRNDDTRVRLEPAPDGSGDLLLTAGPFMLALEVQDGRYPDFERAIPHGDPVGCPVIGVDAEYLAAAATALKPLRAGKYRALTMETWEANTPIRLRCTPDAHGLTRIEGEAVVHVMPARV
jgi:hypothetical protein